MLSKMSIGSRLFLMTAALAVLTSLLAFYELRALGAAQGTLEASLATAKTVGDLVNTVRHGEVAFKIQIQEFKNVLIRGHDAEDYKKYFDAMGKREGEVAASLAKAREALEEYGRTETSAGRSRNLGSEKSSMAAQIEALAKEHSEVSAKYRDSLKGRDLAKAGAYSDADKQVRGIDRAITQQQDDLVDAVLAMRGAIFEEIFKTTRAENAAVRRGSFAAILAWLLVAASLSFIIIRGVTASILTVTGEINAASRRTVETSQSQLSAVQETTTSATELQETAKVAGERAREIQTTLASTAESGQSIKLQLGEATGLLGRAREELQTIVVSVQELSGRNQQIGEIIESVGDVADQTQLLAVNAAIEAAKAGEVGRGFGVVASEMKALAEQSKKSAQRIRGIVGEVQSATADTVRLVEMGQTRLQEALDPVTAILPKIEKLTVQVEESAQSGRQIVAIVAQQGAGIEQISQAMKAIQGGIQEGVAQTQQVERTAETLTVLAGRRRDTVAAHRV